MDYDSAFADLNKALVDLDGDGKPDVVQPRAKLGENRLQPGEVPANQQPQVQQSKRPDDSGDPRPSLRTAGRP